jgi:hypothetical protein
VAGLVNEKKAPGTYDARFDAHGLASGVYISRLVVNDLVHTRGMLLIR